MHRSNNVKKGWLPFLVSLTCLSACELGKDAPEFSNCIEGAGCGPIALASSGTDEAEPESPSAVGNEAQMDETEAEPPRWDLSESGEDESREESKEEESGEESGEGKSEEESADEDGSGEAASSSGSSGTPRHTCTSDSDDAPIGKRQKL